MSQKSAKIIIVIFVLLLIAALLFFFFYKSPDGISPFDNLLPRSNIFPNVPEANVVSTTTGQNDGENPTTEGGIDSTQAAPLLQELSKRAVAGAVSFERDKNVFARYIEKATGNVFEASPSKNGEVRITITTIPKIEEAFFSKNGSDFIARYLKDDTDVIESYYAAIKPKPDIPDENELQGAYLTENIKSLVTAPDRDSIFYLLNHSGGSTGIVAGLDGSKKTEVFASALTEWLPLWVAPNLITLTTKPSSGVAGYMFFLNPKTGKLTKVISGISGLTALASPNGNLLLYAASTGRGLSLNIYSLKGGVNRRISLQTLPDKCLWSKNDPAILYCAVPVTLPEGVYPDAWYQGTVSFQDDIWKIDASTGEENLVLKLSNLTPKEIDGTKLFFSPNEDYLFFTNKNDYHLWSLRLTSQE